MQFNRAHAVTNLLEADLTEAATFFAKDYRNPAAPDLISYPEATRRNGRDEIVQLDGLKLISEGQLAPFYIANQGARKAFVALCLLNKQEIFGAALSNKDPEVITDVLQMTFDHAPANLKSYTYLEHITFKSRFFSNHLATSSLEHIKAVQEFFDRIAPAQEASRVPMISDLIAEYTREFSGGITRNFGKTPEQLGAFLDEAVTLFGATDNGKTALQSILIGGGLLEKIIANDVKTDEQYQQQADNLALCISKAKAAGLNLSDIILKADGRGTTLLHTAVRRSQNPAMIEMLFDTLENELSANQSNQVITTFLDTPQALLANDKVSYTMQDVRSWIKDEKEVAEANLLCPTGIHVFASADVLKEVIETCRPHIEAYIEHAKKEFQNNGYKLGKAKELQEFLDEANPFAQASTILGQANGATLTYLLQKRQELLNISEPDLATDLSKDMKRAGRDAGKSAMHQSWARSVFMGPPGSENAVEENFSSFVKAIHDTFDEDIAIPLVKNLFAIKDQNGLNPLEVTLNDGAEGNYAPYYFPVMVKALAAALNDDALFQRTMDEAIVPNLPEDFGGPAKQVEPEKPEQQSEPKINTAVAASKYLKPKTP